MSPMHQQPPSAPSAEIPYQQGMDPMSRFIGEGQKPLSDQDIDMMIQQLQLMKHGAPALSKGLLDTSIESMKLNKAFQGK